MNAAYLRKLRVVLRNGEKIRHLNLLSRITFDSENILFVFDLHHIDLWLLKIEEEKSFEEWFKNNPPVLLEQGTDDDPEELIPDVDIELSTKSSLTLTIDELDLPVRGYNCLKRIGVNTVEDLIEKTELELLREAKIGAKSLVDILYKLHDLGLALKRDDDPPF